MSSSQLLFLDLLVVGVALWSSALWFRTYKLAGGPSRNMASAIALISLALTAHALQRAGINNRWLESLVIISSVAAGAFWLSASFDVAEGKL